MTEWGEGPLAPLAQSTRARELPSDPRYESPPHASREKRDHPGASHTRSVPRVPAPSVARSASSSLRPHLDWKLQVKVQRVLNSDARTSREAR